MEGSGASGEHGRDDTVTRGGGDARSTSRSSSRARGRLGRASATSEEPWDDEESVEEDRNAEEREIVGAAVTNRRRGRRRQGRRHGAPPVDFLSRNDSWVEVELKEKFGGLGEAYIDGEEVDTDGGMLWTPIAFSAL